MSKLIKFVTFAFVLGVGISESFADPLYVQGNNYTQNRIGSSVANQTLTGIFNSTVANGAAGNTLTVAEAKTDGAFATFIGNSFLQQEIGSTSASQNASGIFSSSVANNAAGNAITFSGQ